MAGTDKVAFLIAPEGTERVELEDPWNAVEDAGYQPVLLSTQDGEAQLFDHLDKAATQSVDAVVDDADIDEYAALVLPGGVANPDNLRMNEDAVEFVKAFVASGKPVAAICHAPWTLVEADVVRGRKIASWPSLQTDLRNAGAEWVDDKVVTDGNLITSRNPDDIPAFTSALIEALEHGAAGTSS
jgi:protease I